MEALTTVWVVLQAGQPLDISKKAAPVSPWAEYLPLAAAIGGGVVVLVALFVFQRIRRREKEVSVSATGGGSGLSQEAREKLESAVRRGDHIQAAELLTNMDRPLEAAEHFLKAGDFRRAADAYEEGGESSQAIHFYKKAGLPTKAARLYLEGGDQRGAAAVYVQADEPERAANCYVEAGDYKRAAKQFARAGKHRKSAENYEKAESALLAARQYDALAGELMQDGVETVAPDSEAGRVCRRAAEMYEKAANFAGAATFYLRISDKREAARCFKADGDLVRAAGLFEELGDSEEAVALLEQAGEQQRAHRAKGEVAVEREEWAQAVDHFRAAGDLRRAAEICADRLGAVEEAAELLEAAEDWLEAGKLYEESGSFAHAAHCAEKGGALAHAAELYRQAGDIDGEIRVRTSGGDLFRAARLLYEQRRYEEALEMLGRINSRDPIYRKGVELQGDVYRAMKDYEQAYSRYRAALGNREPKVETLRLHYKLGRVLESSQDFSGAANHYEEVVGVDQDYKDAAQKLELIQQGLSKERQRQLAANSEEHEAVDIESPGRGVPSSEATSTSAADSPRYDLEEEIARGGMGVVYRARDTFLNRIVAMKLLGEKLRGNETAVKYFLREARAAAALSHPNIVTIFDAGEQEGEYYIAMEYVEGHTLKEIVAAKGPLPEKRVRHVLIEACKALEYAHTEGIVHRDIKSGNIMLQRGGAVKVMDFGLAKFLREYQKEHTQQVGTPYYMSPEQIIGKNVDFRSDLYGLGCTVFECLTGRVPFTEGELAYHHVHTEPPSPRSINGAISEQMEQVILRLLAKDPDDRFESAKKLRAMLEGRA